METGLRHSFTACLSLTETVPNMMDSPLERNMTTANPMFLRPIILQNKDVVSVVPLPVRTLLPFTHGTAFT